jgi:hypothetical protein
MKWRRCMRRKIAILLALTMAAGAQDNAAARAAREWRQQHERAIVDEFFALLAIPNIARDRENIQRNAEFIAGMLEKLGGLCQCLAAARKP